MRTWCDYGRFWNIIVHAKFRGIKFMFKMCMRPINAPYGNFFLLYFPHVLPCNVTCGVCLWKRSL